jgi:predicted nucleotidyltransferase
MATSVRTTTGRVPLWAIRRVVNQIVERFGPERIILFGSHAYGRPRENSDVDLLVVMETDRTPLQQAMKIVRDLDRGFYGLDLIVRTPHELQRRIGLGDFFLREITSKGRVLYERPGA